ncbi:MAG: PEGA domain-containing protein [Planctomycetota bacterium]|jgi:hypothetical protein
MKRTIALALILVGCQQAATQETGTIQLASLPKAEVLLDGKTVGETPLTLDAAAGDHEVVLRSDGFAEQKRKVTVAAGQTAAVECVLAASDPNDPVAIAKLAQGFELGEWSEFAPEERHRGLGDADFVVPGYPRGNVRAGDLGQYRIDVGEEFEGEGKLVFKRGKKVLYEAPFDPEELVTTTSVPKAVLDNLKPGAQVTWGFYPSEGKAVTAKFKLVRDDARIAKRLARIEKQMAGQDEVAVCQLRAQLYLNKKLYTAAYLEGARAMELSKDKEEKPSQALAVMQGAAQRMKLQKTPIWEEIEQQIIAIPKRVKDRRAGAKGR